MTVRIIDLHVHHPASLGMDGPAPTGPIDPAAPGIREAEDELVEAARALGIVRLCVNSFGVRSFGEPPEHPAVEQMMERFPAFVVGFAYLQLGIDGPDAVDALYRRGFRGLKLHRAPANYDDKAFYPIYARAEALRMPILFHTGQSYRRRGADYRHADVGVARMQAVLLDTIARAFPALGIIGAHLGTPMFDQAAWVARWNPNVYFDLSGPITRRDTPLVFNRMCEAVEASGALQQIVFGSDTSAAGLQSCVRAYTALLDRLGADEVQRERVFAGNAAGLLGLA